MTNNASAVSATFINGKETRRVSSIAIARIETSTNQSGVDRVGGDASTFLGNLALALEATRNEVNTFLTRRIVEQGGVLEGGATAGMEGEEDSVEDEN